MASEPIIVNLVTRREGARFASVSQEEAKDLGVDIVMTQPSEEGRGVMDLGDEMSEKINNVIE